MIVRIASRALLAGLLVGAVGCNKDEAKTGGEAAKTGKAAAGKAAGAAKAAPMKPAERIAAPESVVLFGGTSNLAAALDKVHGLVNQVAPGVPKFQTMAGPAIQGEYRLKAATAIDTSKPIRFAVFNPKVHRRQPLALVVGITDKAALTQALPDTGKKENDAGNAFSYLKFEGSTRPIYVNFVGSSAVFTRNKDIFPQNKAFIEALAGATLPELGAVYVEVEHIVTLFGAEFDAGLKQAERMIGMAANAQPGGAASAQVVKTMLDWVGKSARSVDHVALTLATVADGAKLDVTLAAKSGTDLAKQLGQISGKGTQGALAKMPADTAAFMLGNIDPKAMALLSKLTAEAFVVGPMFGGDAAKAKPYIDAMVEYAAGMDGTMALAAYPSAKGVSLAMLMGVADAAKLKSGFDKLAGMYSDPAAAAYYNTLGMDMKYQKDAYDVAGTKATVITTSMKNMPPEAAQMMALMGDFMTQHFAAKGDLAVLAYGNEGKTVLEGFLTGSIKGGLADQPSVKRALKHAAPNFNTLSWINPIALARSVKLGGMNPMAQMLAGVPATSGIAVSTASSEGTFKIVLDVPVATVKEGMAAFEKSKGRF